jgi:hypothetical protein
MKNLHLFQILILTLFIFSCEKDDDQENPVAENPGINATINGGSYSNYSFVNGIYQVTLGGNGTTLSIDASDTNGDQITLFLNGTGGFNSNTVKVMGDIDSNNFMTYVLIRQHETQTHYYSSTGSITITDNRAHPTESGKRLISGNISITANSVSGSNSTTMTGTFLDLEFGN